jgi:hypothetical protein
MAHATETQTSIESASSWLVGALAATGTGLTSLAGATGTLTPAWREERDLIIAAGALLIASLVCALYAKAAFPSFKHDTSGRNRPSAGALWPATLLLVASLVTAGVGFLLAGSSLTAPGLSGRVVELATSPERLAVQGHITADNLSSSDRLAVWLLLRSPSYSRPRLVAVQGPDQHGSVSTDLAVGIPADTSSLEVVAMVGMGSLPRVHSNLCDRQSSSTRSVASKSWRTACLTLPALPGANPAT